MLLTHVFYIPYLPIYHYSLFLEWYTIDKQLFFSYYPQLLHFKLFLIEKLDFQLIL